MSNPVAKDNEPSWLIGQTIGKYKVLRQLGRGGMGAVFEAIQEEIGQRVAIKVMHPELSRETKFAQRFLDEARAISKVKHPGLIQIIAFDRLPDGTLYLVMELLSGELLWDRMLRLRRESSGAFSVSDAARIARQIASAFAAVHKTGIIHRDLKPENVFIVPDPDTPAGERAKILDFGIAKDDSGEGRRTTTGVSIGTPGYMSPEQCDASQKLTDRSDVYSLGIILYEMLAGKPPFQAESTAALMRQHMLREPPPLPSSIPPPLAALVMRALSKEAESRPGMQEVVDSLDRLVHSGSATEVPPRAHGAAIPRRPALLAGTSFVLIAGLLVAYLYVPRRPDSKLVPPTTPAIVNTVPSSTAKDTEKPDGAADGNYSAKENPQPGKVAKKNRSGSKHDKVARGSGRSEAGEPAAQKQSVSRQQAASTPSSPSPKRVTHERPKVED